MRLKETVLRYISNNEGRLVCFLMAFLLLGSSIKFSEEVFEGSHGDRFLNLLDSYIFFLVEILRRPKLSSWFVDLTALGSPLVLSVVVIISAVLFWSANAKRKAQLLLLAGLLSALLSLLLKNHWSRPRPEIISHLVEVHSFSYPSGHSLGASLIYFVLAFALIQNVSRLIYKLILFVIFSLLIGGICFSRVYLGVHYPSDVIEGAIIGMSGGLILVGIFHERSSGLSISLRNTSSL